MAATIHSIDTGKPGRLARAGHVFAHEFRHVLPPTIFFFIGFNLILFTKRLFLAEYLIQFTGFAIATTAALIVGKAVLVADKLPFIRRFDHAPLIQPILFRTAVYSVVVSVARLLEALAHYLIEGGKLGGGRFIEHQLGKFSWDQFIAVQLWIFVLFLIYSTARHLNELFGDGELFSILFKRRSSTLRMTRRARIRALVRVARLTEAHPFRVFEDPASAPHRELVGLVRTLARTDGGTPPAQAGI